MNYVLIGAGSRGLIYGTWAVRHGISIAAIAEKRPDRLRDAAEKLGVPEEMCFSDAAGLLARGKLADAAIIATMDRDHFGHTMANYSLSRPAVHKLFRNAEGNRGLTGAWQNRCHQAFGKYRQLPHGPLLCPG